MNLSRLFICITLILFINCQKKITKVESYSTRNEIEILNKSQDILKEKKLQSNEDRLVIMSATIYLKTKTPDEILNKILNIVKEYKGYVVTATTNRIVFRIPNKKFKEIVDKVSSLDKLVDKYIRGEDVTEEYNDLNINLDNKEKARQRYLELLNKAENVEAALKVEKELERLNGEINVIKGRMKFLDELIQYSTIEVEIDKKVQPGPLGYVVYGVYKVIEWLFIWE